MHGDTAPPGYVTETMTVRDALVSPDEAIRAECVKRLKEGAAQAIDMALKAYVTAAMEETLTFYRARLN